MILSDLDAPIGEVFAVGTAVHSTVPALGGRIEAAMVAAVVQAQAEGVTDTDEIIARKMAAMDVVLASFG